MGVIFQHIETESYKDLKRRFTNLNTHSHVRKPVSFSIFFRRKKNLCFYELKLNCIQFQSTAKKIILNCAELLRSDKAIFVTEK